MKRRLLPTMIMLSLVLNAQAGDELIIDITLNDDLDVVLPEAINTANADGGRVFIRFEPGVHRFDAAPSGPSRLPPISSEVLFQPTTNGPVTLDGGGGNARGIDIISTGAVTFDSIEIRNFGNGGIFNDGGTLNLTDATVSGNSASGEGGGIFNSGGTLSIDNSTISGNTSGMNGGGLFIEGASEVTISDSVIAGNTAAEEGGGLWNSDAGQLTFESVTISDNSATAGGGIFLRTGPAAGAITGRELVFSGNTATADGGGMGIDLGSAGGGTFTFTNVEVSDNEAGINGGGIDLSGTGRNNIVVFRNLDSRDNRAGVFGEHLDVDVRDGGSSPVLLIQGGLLAGNAPGVVGIENPSGVIALLGMVIQVDGKDALDTTDQVFVGNTLFDNFASGQVPRKSGLEKATCNTFGIGVIQSLGGNISLDSDCGLSAPSDQQNTDAGVVLDSGSGKLGLNAGSPAIDAALSIASTLFPGESSVLDCGYKDVNGLGRPQDGNLDGNYECDSGFVEAQGGPDIGPAQSSAYFDTGRNGEGVFVELIGNGLAFVAMFTYLPDGSGTAWFVGIGEVVGNSVVVDSMLQVEGGVFGAGFDPALVTRTTVGGLSLNFSNCAAGAQPGRLAFQASPDQPFSDLLAEASRLSTIVDCAGGTGSSQSGRSGSFFDVSRSGEGIFVQWLTNGAVVVIWYTFDSNGNPLWIINDVARTTVSGNTVTATMLYPTAFTAFGSGFDASEVVLSDWGTVTLQYQPGCSDVGFAYSATAPGFGSGSYDYTRLTGLAGTTCDL